MAFDNPFLRPSATRQSALRYLWSDEPESVVPPTPTEINVFGTGESPTQATPTSVAPASIGDSSDSTGVTTAEATPYGGLFGGLPGWAVKGINMGIPGFGALYGAAAGYAGQTSANTLGEAMEAWGGEPNVSGNAALAALGGAVGYTPEALENAQAFAGNFSNETNMAGYISAVDPSSALGSLTQAIAATQMGQNVSDMTADDFGALAVSTQAAVDESMAQGNSLPQAVTAVGIAQGVPATAIAAIAANLNTEDPLGQLAANLGLAPDPQAAVNAEANAMPIDPGILSAIAAQGTTDTNLGGGGWVDSSGNPVVNSKGEQWQTTTSAEEQAAAQAAVNAEANAMAVDPGVQAAVAAQANVGTGDSVDTGGGYDAEGGVADGVDVGGGYGSVDDFGGTGDSVDVGGGYDAEGGVADGVDADGGGGGGDGGSDCVIATHAVANGSFTPREKRKAVVWCTKTLHNKWWGEAIRKGYRFHGMKAINAGKAENYYDEFRDFVRFATGTKRTPKTAKTFIWRSVQFFVTGIFLKD